MGEETFAAWGSPHLAAALNVDEKARSSRHQLRMEGELKGSPEATTGELIAQIIKARRTRDDFFGSNLFADPAWDMLLQAYRSELSQVRLSITALCSSAGAPQSTALRWLTKLVDDGWLIRNDDPFDGRRSWVKLSPKGLTAMARYFKSLPAHWMPI